MRWLAASFPVPALIAMMIVVAIPCPAFAQDEDDFEIPDLPEDIEEDAGDLSADDADAEDSDEGEGVEEVVPVSSSPETLYAIQQKPRLVGGSFEIAPQFIQSVNNRFVSHTGMMLSGIYHMKENMALELNVGGFFWLDEDGVPYLGGHETDTTLELRERERLAPELVKLYWLTWVTSADLQWSPIYGKVSVQDLILAQFNVYLSVGAGLTGLAITGEENLPGPFGSALPPMAIATTIGGGLRFYFFDWLGVRVELRDYVQALSALAEFVDGATISTFEVRNTLLAQVGVSFVF